MLSSGIEGHPEPEAGLDPYFGRGRAYAGDENLLKR
jgi:hypothetical protein